MEAEEDEELREAFEVGTLKYRMEHMDVDRWLADLAADKQQLSMLAESAGGVDPERDAKLEDLKAIIKNKVTAPSTNTRGEANRKIIVFCAFADTAAYLYEQLEGWATDALKVNIALVSGGARPNRATFGKAEFNQILTNFAPRAKQRHKMPSMPQVGEIDILIATDCISEGQNLQDCDLLVNYDNRAKLQDAPYGLYGVVPGLCQSQNAGPAHRASGLCQRSGKPAGRQQATQRSPRQPGGLEKRRLPLPAHKRRVARAGRRSIKPARRQWWCAGLSNGKLRLSGSGFKAQHLDAHTADKTVLVVFVPEADTSQKPIYLQATGLPKGAFRRIGSTDQRCVDEDLWVLRGASQPQFGPDMAPIADARMDDFEPQAVAEYRRLRALVNPQAEELAYGNDDMLEALSAARRVGNELKPTLAGIVLFGKPWSNSVRTPGKHCKVCWRGFEA